MAAASWKLVQAFIRETTEDESFGVVEDMGEVYRRLRELQRGHFTATTGTGTTLINSTVGGKQFGFTIAASLAPAQIIAIAETALQLTEGRTIAQLRALLRRRTTTRADFSTYRP